MYNNVNVNYLYLHENHIHGIYTTYRVYIVDKYIWLSYTCVGIVWITFQMHIHNHVYMFLGVCKNMYMSHVK
jgi:hypothetical protein